VGGGTSDKSGYGDTREQRGPQIRKEGAIGNRADSHAGLNLIRLAHRNAQDFIYFIPPPALPHGPE
jgi:hypothetical protein